jgi:hypothetical protein
MSNIKKDYSVHSWNETVEPLIVAASIDSPDEPALVIAGIDSDGHVEEVSEPHTAEFVNPTDYEDYWRNHFYAAPYYVSGCVWSDYRPAYRLGFDAYFSNRGRGFDEVESALVRSWETIKDNSHLTWSQAKQAVHDGWQFVESAVSGTPNRSLQ